MSYPPPGGTDPYQPQQPYGQQPGYDPTTPYNPGDPYAAPSSGAPGQSPYGQPTSGQPGYGAPTSGQPYAQPGYGSPYGQQPYTPSAQTNTMAILSLVFAFVFPIAGIVMGHVARKQMRQTGEGGGGLATAGLWLSYIFTIGYVILCAAYVGLAIFAATSSTSTY